MAWVRKMLRPESVIVAAYAHRDELTHHLHVLAIPVHNDELGWCQVRDAAVEAILRRSGESKSGRKRRRYAALQDDFQHEVGRHFNLHRGERDSGRRHQAINRTLAAEEQARKAEARQKRASEELEELEQTLAECRPVAEELERQIALGTTGWLSKRARKGRELEKGLKDRAQSAEMARDTALERVTSLESTVEQVTAERDTAQARGEVLESERRQGAGAAARAFIETVQDDEPEPSKIRAAVRAAERRLMGALRPLVALLARKARLLPGLRRFWSSWALWRRRMPPRCMRRVGASRRRTPHGRRRRSNTGSRSAAGEP